jgi:hypothetical protein
MYAWRMMPRTISRKNTVCDRGVVDGLDDHVTCLVEVLTDFHVNANMAQIP